MSLTSCIKKQVEGVQVVDIATYEKQLKQPEVQLIDVRTPEEFSQGHLENAKNINIMAEDFDTAWQEYMDAYNACSPQILMEDLQQEVMRRICR